MCYWKKIDLYVFISSEAIKIYPDFAIIWSPFANVKVKENTLGRVESILGNFSAFGAVSVDFSYSLWLVCVRGIFNSPYITTKRTTLKIKSFIKGKIHGEHMYMRPKTK